MYCDLWPYVLCPLDLQIQKRIVSAETIGGNTVVPFEFGRVTISRAVGNQLVTGGSPEDMKIAMESVFVAPDSSPLLNR